MSSWKSREPKVWQRQRYKLRKLPYFVRQMIMPAMIIGGILVCQVTERSGAQVGRLFDGLSSKAPRPMAETIKGRALVVDGDTIEIAGQRVRANGIDAPESSQYCEDATLRT